MAFVPLSCPSDGNSQFEVSIDEQSGRLVLKCGLCEESVSFGPPCETDKATLFSVFERLR